VLLLVVDTSTAAVTAAVIELIDDDPRLLAVRAPHDARGHGELLAPSIAAALDDASADIGDIGALVAGLGPGPFTGLRVGLVTAAVIADVRGVPVYGVCSLDGIGAALPDAENLLVATDARRREVYWARYERGQQVHGPGVARPAEVDLTGVTAVAGPGAELYAEAWPDLPRHEIFPDPVALVRVARDRIAAGAPSDPLTPLYLRRPDATVPAAPKPVSQVTESQ
jgi:tRNA threonylcarbamoyl adenosine modification protein YeaZ